MSTILRATKTPQASLGSRLGWINITDFTYPDLTYKLRLPSPDDCEVARRLVAIAVKDKEANSLNNLEINGRPTAQLAEDGALWLLLTSARRPLLPVRALDYFSTRPV